MSNVLNVKKTQIPNLREELVGQVLLVLIPVVIVFVLVMRSTNYHFTYTLDDPYIHLTLAKNLWHGFYGINMGEASAPSSSILWPFLLSPFSIFGGYFEYFPLLINVLCLAGLVHLLFLIFNDVRRSLRIVLIFILLMSTNAYGLVFTGMEHCLQILLVVLAAYPLYKEKWCLQSMEVPVYQIIALILLPLVRYEGLAISIPILFYLFTKDHWVKASIGFITILFALGCFSAFLNYNGLGVLPSSVIAKFSPVFDNLEKNLEQYGYLLLPIAVMEVVLWKKNPLLAVVIIFITMLHFTFGHYGWLGRYETYYIVFMVILACRLVIDCNLPLFPAVLVLPAFFYSLFMTNFRISLCSANIFYQQAQIANIFGVLNEPIAVNDLGLVSFRNPGNYVLDLFGLGSIDSLKQRIANRNSTSSIWISDLMNRKNVKYAFIFDNWFKYKPESWVKVGAIKVKFECFFINDTVTLYSVDKIHADKLVAALKSYEPYINKDKVELVIYPGAGTSSN